MTTIEQAKNQVAQIISLQNYTIDFALLSGVKLNKIQDILTAQTYTEFELETAKRALAFGQFNETVIVNRSAYIFAYFLPNGKDVYRKQLQTAKELYEKISAKDF